MSYDRAIPVKATEK
jgi:hypothetical protein